MSAAPLKTSLRDTTGDVLCFILKMIMVNSYSCITEKNNMMGEMSLVGGAYKTDSRLTG